MTPIRVLISRLFLFFLVCSGLSEIAHAQTKNRSTFQSAADRDLSVRTVTAVPFSDNVGGIYATPLSAHFRELLSQDPRWAWADSPAGVRSLGLADRPGDIQKILATTGAQGVFVGHISKGPAGLHLKIALHTGPEGWPLVIEEHREAERFEIAALKNWLTEGLTSLKKQMPYQGSLLSRRASEVTINLGSADGLKEGSDLSIIQILSVHRHPKQRFVVGVDREILGKVRVTKADEHLSFARILYEKDVNLLEPGLKVMMDQIVVYPEPLVDREGKVLDELNRRADRPVAFGETPVEWVPEAAPQYGSIQIFAGLGQYQQNAHFVSAGGVSGSNSLAPILGIQGEGWLSQDWYFAVGLRQSVFAVSNGLSGSSPSRLNVSLGNYHVLFGRNILLSPEFFGPKLQLSLGLSKFTSVVDDSTPVLFSNMNYGGLALGMSFNTPISDDGPWELGARLRYYWSPTVGESVSSGATESVGISDFGVLASYRVRRTFRYTGDLGFEHYAADFAGGGDRSESVTSISHRLTALTLGLEYSF